MIIGITGGIGSGKSTIAKQLRLMGYEVYDTDQEAKRLIVEDIEVRHQIEELFGAEVYQDNVYQTTVVAQRVFADHELLARLNAIVHPAVRQDIVSRFSSLASDQSPHVFIECAILYQAGIDQLCDKVVVITAPEEVRLERTIARDHSDINKVRARMRAQNVKEDLHRSDIVINNDGTTPIEYLCKEMLLQIK
jgi:dephospho-CoA kinase